MRATQPGQSFLLFLDVVEVLERENIDYAVIGAVAASVHGSVRASLDADALLSLTVASLAASKGRSRAADFRRSCGEGRPMIRSAPFSR